MPPTKQFWARARPFVDELAIREALAPVVGDAPGRQGLAFTSARGALKWLLSDLAERKPGLRVGVQALTCPSVIHAILEAKALPRVIDIELEHFSTPLREIPFEELDVLILTHLFGIANPEYRNIVERAHAAGIVVVEDLAQSTGASIGKDIVGSLGDFSLSSFGTDKPVSAFRGGMLAVRDAQALERLESRYRRLRSPNEASDRRDLRRLAELYRDSDPSKYDGPVAPGVLERIRLKVANNLPIAVSQMGTAKSRYLARMFEAYPLAVETRRDAALAAREWISKNFPECWVPATSVINRSTSVRLPMLSPPERRSEIVSALWARGIECGPHNWPYLGIDSVRNYRGAREFPIARSVSRRIVNLPVWSREIWRQR